MPFTPSHAVAILPFARTPLPAAALVIGSMAPDLQYFVPLSLTRQASHSWPGIITIDLPIGIVALLLWVYLLRGPVLDYSPPWLRERMRPIAPVRNRLVHAALVLVAIEIGVLTHLLLDLPTHGGWLADQWTWMYGSIGPVTILRLLHAGASLVGAAIIAWWTWRWASRTPRIAVVTRLSPRQRVFGWVLITSTLFVVMTALWAHAVVRGGNPLGGNVWFFAFCVAAGCAIAVVIGLAVVWRFLRSGFHERMLS
jgi:hypothetical protein